MDYQNLFTQVQVVAEPHHGSHLNPRKDERERIGQPFLVHLFGRLGNAQIGPVYLGTIGVASLFFGMIGFQIIGWNMLSSVNWDPIQFVRQLFWLSLDPPLPKHGLSLVMPLSEGGWWMMAGAFLTASILLWWWRTYRRAIALGMGTHIAWAFLAAIWLFLVLGFFRPLLVGSWSEGVPFGVFSHLD
ncbi:MAG: photosynthetic reaction center subunit M, partial [Burkholderiaceae bacterium]|nr:photosynthetic reaction center subunit M [Burkholderiaceae bacterium]